MRNDFVHYKPKTRNTQDFQKDFDSLLSFFKKRKVSLNPIADYTGNPFPHGMMSHSIAQWAIDSVSKFIEEFETAIGGTAK